MEVARAYYSYTRGNGTGVLRLCKKYGISVCHIVDIALTNRGPNDDFQPRSDLLHGTIRDLEKTGEGSPVLGTYDLNWTAMTAACAPILRSRTTRE